MGKISTVSACESLYAMEETDTKPSITQLISMVTRVMRNVLRGHITGDPALISGWAWSKKASLRSDLSVLPDALESGVCIFSHLSF